MKKKIVGLCICMLVIATVIPAVGVMIKKEIPTNDRIGFNSLNHQSTSRNIMNSNYGGMFIQLPHSSDEGPIEWASEPTRQILEDFWQIPSPICDVHWWGEYVLYEGGVWSPLDPNLMNVNISFYDDDSGQPGNEVASYINVKPSVNATGLWYDWGDPFLWQLYYFEYELDPCVNLSQGWVSISNVASSDNGWFLWISSPDGNNVFFRNESGTIVPYAYDVALVLTDGEPADSDLECDGELSWTDIKPGDTVTGDFVVRNNGDIDSILHWKVESYPNWGSNWTFTPNASILLTADDWITIDVEAIAPEEKNKEFPGKVKLVNVMDSSDYCEIEVFLKTPINKGLFINHPVLNWFFERFPHAFPILRQLMGY